MAEDLNAKQSAWWNRFRRLMSSMPDGIEVVVLNGSTLICEKGALTRYHEQGSSGEIDSIDSVATSGLLPYGEIN